MSNSTSTPSGMNINTGSHTWSDWAGFGSGSAVGSGLWFSCIAEIGVDQSVPSSQVRFVTSSGVPGVFSE